MSALTIAPVQSKSELMDFISFPWKVYANDPYWVPPLVSERVEFLDRDHHPFFEHAQADFFLAKRNGEIVGTIGAISNQLYNEYQEANDGFFGFFEVLEDQEAAEALLKTAEVWVREAGHENIIGPVQYSTNEELGLLIDGFEDRPRILMTYNPPRYQGYIEGTGYTKAMDMFAYSADVATFLDNIPPKITRVAEKIRKRYNLTVRPINMKKFDHEVEQIKVMYNASWVRNWGFVPMTDAEVDLLAKNLKQIIDPDFALMIEQDGRVIGFAIGLPDLNQPLQKAYPRPGTPELLTMLKLVWHWKVRKDIDWIRVWALGLLPEFRGHGFDSLMYIELINAALRKGYKWGEMSWILESNDMINRAIQVIGGKVYKTYRLYSKAL